MRNVLLLSLVSVGCFACAQALVIDKPTLVTDNRDLVCKKITPIGTIRARTVCTTAAQREEHRQAAQAGMEQRKEEEQAEALRRVFRGPMAH